MNTNNIPPYRPPAPPPVPVSPVPARQTKNKFWTVFWALIPGAGQMYQGRMKRGVSLMLLFTGVIAVAAFTYLGVLTVLLPVIWFYALFDTLNHMQLTVQELQALPDDFLLIGEGAGIRLGRDSVGRFVEKRHLLLGWALVIFSVWLFLKLLFSYGYGLYDLLLPEAVRVIRDILNVFPSLLVPALCIVLGVRLIVGRKEPAYDEYTIPRIEDKEPASAGSPEPTPNSKEDH